MDLNVLEYKPNGFKPINPDFLYHTYITCIMC